MTRWPLYIALFLAAYFVFNTTNEFQSECYQILPSEGDTRQILLNKCSGKTWMLIYTTLIDEKGKETGTFTYRWRPISKFYEGEAELSKQ